MTSHNAGGPHKVVLGTYSTHEAAQHAVDVLAEHKFPVEHVTIVGNGLKLEERILGRWTLGRALLTGAGTGAWIGLLIGLIFWIVSPWAPGALVSGVILGLVFGAVFSAIAYALHRRAYMSARGRGRPVRHPGRLGVHRRGTPPPGGRHGDPPGTLTLRAGSARPARASSISRRPPRW